MNSSLGLLQPQDQGKKRNSSNTESVGKLKNLSHELLQSSTLDELLILGLEQPQAGIRERLRRYQQDNSLKSVVASSLHELSAPSR